MNVSIRPTREGVGVFSFRSRSDGMTLVTTLLLMVPLVIIALGFVTLSTVAVRTSMTDSPAESAQANARIALELALGELQRQAGPDTRVTARADILQETNPPVLGVWRSWEGTDHEITGPFAGRPVSPGADYRTVKDARFLAWLTSANGSDPATLPNTARGPGKVTLVGPGSVGAGRPASEIHLTPTVIESDGYSASFAWWISGENQKARIPKPYKPAPTSQTRLMAEWAKMNQSHSVADPKPFRLEPLLEDPQAAQNLLSLSQADLIASPSLQKASREFFHDLSAVSSGLLTNTATGGWRKDMSLLSERWSGINFPKNSLTFFRISPDDDDASGSFAEESNVQKPGSLFYPWSSYTNYGPGGSIVTQQPVASWNSLMNFTSFYKVGSSVGTSGVRTLESWSARRVEGGPSDSYRHLHKINTYPLVARIQWVFSHFSQRVGEDFTNPGSFLYNPKLLVTPVITLWNPYDVKISHADNYYFDFKLMPVSLSYQMKDTVNTRYNSIIHVDYATAPLPPFDEALVKFPGFGAIRIQCSIPSAGTTFNPGQTIVYSPAAGNRIIPGNGQNQIPLEKGFRFTGGHLYPVKHGTQAITSVTGSTRMRVRARFDTEYKEWAWQGAVLSPRGVGVYTQIGTSSDPHNQQVQYLRSTYSPDLARILYPAVAEHDLVAPTVSEVEAFPMPFLSTVFGLRSTTKTNSNLIPQYDIKGLAQSTPFGNWKTSNYRDEIYAYAGTGHPHTSRFNYSFVTYSSGGSTDYPGSGPAPDHNGYIITGEQSGSGLPRAIVAGLPSRPLASLVELTHWDLRFENPAPPFAFNIIGNSDASPLLPSNAVVNAADASGTGIGQGTQNFRHDDFYCANHLLFDDWFFSSITENPADFSSGIAKSLQRVYSEFVTGVSPLTNVPYKPLPEDRATALATLDGAIEVYNNHVKKIDSWRTVASRLEVEGMFNVNSTSVAAWRGLLGHARNQRIPYIQHGASWSIGLSDAKNHVVSRSMIAGEDEADTPIPGAFPEASEVTGYRTLDEGFIDELAREIVNQVRLRGPFLSLAEFINRQLSDDKSLALAGALQAALNEVSKTSANNPLAGLQSMSKPTVANVPEGAAAEDKIAYVFPEAAEGYSTYGVPGWTRQADILRPIAPILSARDDTFTIRAYGDTRDAAGNVLATAVCEAVVRRSRHYVDPVDAADITTAPTSAANQTHGRKFEIISFRWLRERDI